jgi:16S rRNA processing protein RimM
VTDSPELLAVGRIRRAHGVRGEVVVELMTDAPDAIFAPGRRVFVGAPDGTRWRDAKSGAELTFHITGVRPFQHGLLVTFDAIGDRDIAERWRNHTLLVPRDEVREPASDELWMHEIPGMRAVDVHGAALGEVRGYYEVPQGIVLEIVTERGVRDVPYNDVFVRSVSRADRVMTLDVPAGLLE